MHYVTFLIDIDWCLGEPISNKVQPKRQLNVSKLIKDSSEIDTLLPIKLIPLLGSAADSSTMITLASEVLFLKAWKGRMKLEHLQKNPSQ